MLKIGIDAHGNGYKQPAPTTTLTVITDKKGNLVNVYPGYTNPEGAP